MRLSAGEVLMEDVGVESAVDKRYRAALGCNAVEDMAAASVGES